MHGSATPSPPPPDSRRYRVVNVTVTAMRIGTAWPLTIVGTTCQFAHRLQRRYVQQRSTVGAVFYFK